MHDPRFPIVVTCMTGLSRLTAINPSRAGEWEALVRVERFYARAARHLHGLTRSEAMSELLAEAVRAHAAHPPEPSVAGWLAAAVPQDDTAAELRLRTLEASRSWRLTAPLRSAARAVRERVRP